MLLSHSFQRKKEGIIKNYRDLEGKEKVKSA
jgi:hypothetical protein